MHCLRRGYVKHLVREMYLPLMTKKHFQVWKRALAHTAHSDVVLIRYPLICTPLIRYLQPLTTKQALNILALYM